MSTRVSFSDDNEIIFSDEQKECIIKMFPEELHEILKSINNPLNEKEVILKIFAGKNIKIMCVPFIDRFGDPEYKHYFNCKDLAIDIKYDTTSINKWNSRFKINIVQYSDIIKSCSDKMYEHENSARTFCTSTDHTSIIYTNINENT